MNPHLNFGQAVPGRCHGRGIGIIDTLQLCRLGDAVKLLKPASDWTARDHAAIRDWFRQYLQWLLDSDLGREEATRDNNHGTWYDAQVAAFALFTGQTDTARSVLSNIPQRRIHPQIEPDGRQPHELARTRSLNYSTMNLNAFFTLAQLAQHLQKAGNLATRRLLPPALAGSMEIRAQVAMTCVLEGETVKRAVEGRQDREGVVHANRARMIVERLAEVRLPHPRIHVRADLQAQP